MAAWLAGRLFPLPNDAVPNFDLVFVFLRVLLVRLCGRDYL